MGGRQTKETKSYFLEYGAASHQGRRPTHDGKICKSSFFKEIARPTPRAHAAASPPFAAAPDRFDVDIMLGGDQAKSYFGVFDGHFGHTAAEVPAISFVLCFTGRFADRRVDGRLRFGSSAKTSSTKRSCVALRPRADWLPLT